MRFGVHLPQWGTDATRAGVLDVARTVEDAGLDSVWVADHLIFPLHSESRYPYRGDGAPFGADDGFLEGLTTLALVAGATERVALGTSVLVLPMRHPLELAKTIATLDVLSGGRTIVAVGAGWWEEEFRALDAPFAGRGRRLDEQLDILHALWAGGRLEHHGEHYDFGEVACEPRPVQQGGPPIWIGGMGPTARRRAARRGSGWHAVGSHADTLREGRSEIDRLALEAGRDPGDLACSASVGLPDDPGRAQERMVRLGRAGVDHAVMNVAANTTGEICQAVERFAAEVLPAVRRELASAHV